MKNLTGAFFVATLIIVTTFNAVVETAQSDSRSPENPELRAELTRMRDEDQAARQGFAQAASQNDQAYLERLAREDTVRTDRLKAIVARSGWPTVAMVGRDGVEAAWMILQHAPDVEWQARMLPTLERAAGAGDIRRGEVALLTDRVLVRSGKPQRYGSQFSIVSGRLVADPIEDEANVDARRAAVGLPPMAELVKLLIELNGLPVEWPRK